MKHSHYIGITGFTKRCQVDQLEGCLRNINEHINADMEKSNTKIMIGVLASTSTLSGKTNRWPHLYPRVQYIGNIFKDNSRYLNLIHFNSSKKEELYIELMHLTELGGKNLHGFQLNVSWPDIDTLVKYKSAYGKMKIVLQIGGYAFKKINHSPSALVERLAEYSHLVDYVLLDPSGGYGRPFDPKTIIAYLEEIYSNYTILKEMGIGIAGGFGPNDRDLDHLREVKNAGFNHLSIDAQAKILDSNGIMNHTKAYLYIKQTHQIFY